MKMKINLREIERKSSASSLAEAKRRQRELQACQQFKYLKVQVQSLAEGVILEDGRDSDFCQDRGRVILANGRAQTGGYRDQSGSRENTSEILVDADLHYTTGGLATKAFIDVKKTLQEARWGRCIRFEPGMYEYEKKKTVEIWSYTAPDGLSMEYRLSRGVLTVTQETLGPVK